MKGTVLKCVQEMIEQNFGGEAWETILGQSTYPKHLPILASADVPDEQIYSVIGTACTVLGITQEQAFDAFAEHWLLHYGKRVYRSYYGSATNSREFLLGLDRMHEVVTRNVPGASPPRFDYAWEGEDTLVMTYKSKRNLVDLMVAMARAVGKLFGGDIEAATKVGSNKVRIKFRAIRANARGRAAGT